MNFSQWGKEPDQTGFDKDKLIKIAQSSVRIPEGFNVH